MMGEEFSHTKASVVWLIAVTAGGVIASVSLKGTSEWLLGIGLGLVLLAGWHGCHRIDRFYRCEHSITPTKLEGIIGWTGAAMIISSFVGILLRTLRD